MSNHTDKCGLCGILIGGSITFFDVAAKPPAYVTKPRIEQVAHTWCNHTVCASCKRRIDAVAAHLPVDRRERVFTRFKREIINNSFSPYHNTRKEEHNV